MTTNEVGIKHLCITDGSYRGLTLFLTRASLDGSWNRNFRRIDTGSSFEQSLSDRMIER